MPILNNDSLQPLHPRPLVSTERKLVGSTYVDYIDEADVNNTVNAAFRTNKYFWIAGNLYHTPDGTTYNLVGGKDTTWTTTDDFFQVVTN